MAKPARFTVKLKDGKPVGVRRTNPPKTVKGKIAEALIKKATGKGK